jgi:hypothetical protein
LSLILITIVLQIVMVLAAGEVIVRFACPQSALYPRFKFSEDYGTALYENTTMIHRKPGFFSYSYRINEYGYRGKAIPFSIAYERANIVVLGDSNAFGTGVNDGEEFPAIATHIGAGP